MDWTTLYKPDPVKRSEHFFGGGGNELVGMRKKREKGVYVYSFGKRVRKLKKWNERNEYRNN